MGKKVTKKITKETTTVICGDSCKAECVDSCATSDQSECEIVKADPADRPKKDEPSEKDLWAKLEDLRSGVQIWVLVVALLTLIAGVSLLCYFKFVEVSCCFDIIGTQRVPGSGNTKTKQTTSRQPKDAERARGCLRFFALRISCKSL